MGPIKPRTIVLLLMLSRPGRIMFTIVGGIPLAIVILSFLPWLLAGAAWIFGILIVVAVAAGAVCVFWVSAQSSSALAVELMIGAALVVWLFTKMPRRPSGQPNFAVWILRRWVRVISAPVLAPMEHWRSVQDRRLRGERVNVVEVTAGLTWSCLVGIVLSYLTLSVPLLAAWGVLSIVWAK
jgi:hypothetical protein